MAKRILFIAPYPFDEAPSQRFRFEQYFPYLKANGFDPVLKPFLDEKGWKALYKEGGFTKKALAMCRSFMRRWGLLFQLRKYDHIFIHREASMIGPPVFEWIIAKLLRRKYIYDFDDAIWLPNYSDTNARFHKMKLYGKVRLIIKWADQVSAGNEFLADFARVHNPNVQIIPTSIDTEKVHNKMGNPDNEIPVIGWTGSHTTASYIATLLPVLDNLYATHPFIFRVISNQDPQLNRSYVDFVKWTRDNEIEALATFNIGLMPLEDSIWAQGKCGFKALQYMALNIPAVVSPVGVNPNIVIHGENGFLCESQDEWQQTLQTLISNPELRKLVGQKGRSTVEKTYSVKACEQKYLNLFQ